MDQHANLLLSAETLRRETGLVRGQTVGSAFALKRLASQTYLVVDKLQAGVLAEFAEPKNVPQALENCIRNRKCPPLHAFYDLILKAHRAGLLRSEELCTEAPATIERPSVRWFLSIPPHAATVSIGLGVLAAVGACFHFRTAALPDGWLDAVAGWLAACVALSASQVLAAAALRGAGCEVHHPHMRWMTWAPHFAIDQADACMTGRLGRATIEVAALLPLALVSAAALWWRASSSLLPLAALFLACRPVGASPFARLLGVLRREPLLSTDGPSLFDAPLTLGERLRKAWRRFDPRVAALQFTASVAWTFGVGGVIYQLLQLRITEVLKDWSHWEKSLLVLGGALLAVSLLWLTAKIQARARAACAALWHSLRLAWRRSRHPAVDATADVDRIEALIRANPLLGRLDPAAQMELALCGQPFAAAMWQTLVRFDAAPDHVTLIVSGRASIYRRLKSGRKSRFLRVQEGDLFGAHHLVDATGANFEIVTRSRLVALAIPSADFKRIVIDRLSPAVVSAYLHKHLFLQNSSPLCAGWRPAAVARFADLADTTEHSAGGRILARGQEVPSLYVLYEGHARARDKHQRTSTLNPGDFFGEVNLLQTSAAGADVDAREGARSLVVDRLEFIRFMTRNHHVALQMERLCTRRLGRPIFPLERTAFEER
jgi:CRP-like cAMP-binding protein